MPLLDDKQLENKLLTNQVQARVSPYEKWVILKLCGVKGNTVSAVVSRIIGDWIGMNRRDLDNQGLDINTYRDEERARLQRQDDAENG